MKLTYPSVSAVNGSLVARQLESSDCLMQSEEQPIAVQPDPKIAKDQTLARNLTIDYLDRIALVV